MAKMSGKRAFLQLLKEEGVSVIFGNPGTTELPLMDALAVEEGMRYVLGLQEAAVMAMADGYAQASGGLAFASLHVSPGLGNAMGMLYNAMKAGSPILVTAGQHDQSFTVTEPILWGDLPRIARPLVKWAEEVRRIEDLPRLLRRAAKAALSPPTGPVFLSLPTDVLNDEIDLKPANPTRVAPRLRGDPDALRAAARVLARAERPLLIAGDAVAKSRAFAEIVRLAELLAAPVYAEGIPNTASFPASHPLFRGSMTRLAPAIREILEQSDVLFSVGGDLFTMSLPSEVEPVPQGLRIVHLDTDPWELGKNYPEAVAIFGDPKATLPELCEEIDAARSPGEREAAAARLTSEKQAAAAAREALRARAREEAGLKPIRPLALMEAVGSLLPPEAVVIDEAISSGAGLRSFLKSDDPQSFFGNRGGGIGWGIPAAIGAKIALPERPVVALIGDGSAMYTCQALWSAAHERAAVVFIILNNASYRILKQRTNALRGFAHQSGRYVAMDLVDPALDFVGLARAQGIEGERITKLAELTERLPSVLAENRPFLFDVALDGSFAPV